MSVIIRLKSPATLVALGLFIATLGLYFSTLAPTLTWGWNDMGVDGGELLAAAYTSGVPHPPGYPTYTLLLKLFATVVPVGDFAFRGNLMSAVLASVSVVAVYTIALKFCLFFQPKAPRWLALVAASLGASVFATSPLFWSQAVITEVYTLNVLLVGALIIITTQVALPSFPDDKTTKVIRHSMNPRLALFGLLLGLGLGNHLTILAVAVPLLYWIGSRVGWKKTITAWLVIPLLAGMMIYVYLPIQAAQHPPINWGNADTIQGAIWMLTAGPYQEYVFGVTTETLINRVLDWTQLVFVQFNPLGLFIGLMAIGPLRRLAPRFFYPSLASILILSVYSINYSTFDFQVLMIPAFFIFATWIGIGFFWLVSTSIRDFSPAGGMKARWRNRITAAHQASVLSILAFALLPTISLILNYNTQDRSGDRWASEHAAEIMATVPDGSVVLSHSEQNVFSLWYMRYVETPERDIAVIATPLLQFDWYLDDLHRMFPDRIPLIATSPDLNDAIHNIARHNVGKAGVYSTFNPVTLTDHFNIAWLGKIYQVKPQ